MFNEKDLPQYFRKHNVPIEAQTYIRSAFENEPSRRTGLNAINSRSGAYFSRKMGRTIQTESEGAEYAFAVQCEYSDSCLAYLDQIPPFYITSTSKNGRKQKIPYTPDFLVLGTDGPRLVQCKTAEEALDLTKSRTTDWKEEDGHFSYIPASIAAEKHGLKHRVYTPGPTTELLVGNLTLLMQSRLYPHPSREELLDKVRRAFSDNGLLTLKSLWERCQLDSMCPLYQLIDEKALFTRLSKDNLSNPESAIIATREGYLPITERTSPDLRAPSVDELPKENALKRALRNRSTLDRKSASARTSRYWRAKIKEAIAQGKSALSGLVPKWANCGNRRPRIVGKRAEFFVGYMKDEYPKDRTLSFVRAHANYLAKARAFHPLEEPVGIKAFTSRAKADPVATAEAIGGKRAKNEALPSSDVEHRSRRPQRAFELAHIDHHNTDIHLCIKVNGQKLFTIRVWLTVMVDAYSECVLAFWISAKAPSRRACSMVLRRCLRTHGKLPENIITDHGAEFESTFYAALLAFCGICKKERPAGHPRFGSEAERLFKLFTDFYIDTRPGRIRSVLESRCISKSHSSQVKAQLTPELFADEIAGFFDWYNTIYIRDRDGVPRLTLLNNNADLLGCCGVPVEYDQKFIIASSVDFNEYTVDCKRGIQTTLGWFFDPAVCELAGQRIGKLIAREDPEFPHRIYVLVKNKWISFRHTADKNFHDLTQSQQLAAALRFHDGRAAKTAQKAYASELLATRLAEFDEALVADEKRTQRSEPEPSPPEENLFQKARRKSVNPTDVFSGRVS